MSNKSPRPGHPLLQSAEIVKAMQQLGLLDANGWLRDDPRVGQGVSLCAAAPAAI